MYWNPNYEFFGPTGWRCPSCGRVYSPSTYMCPYCGGNQKVRVVPTTNDSEWWEEYLKQTTTGKPSLEQDSIHTIASTDKNIATTAWNCIDTDVLDSFMKHFRGLDE